MATALNFLRPWTPSVQGWLARAARAREAVVVAGVNPVADSGGGKRPAQLAAEFLRRGWAVLHVYRFPRYESVDLPLPLDHPGLLELDVRRERVGAVVRSLLRRRSPRRVRALVEVPAPEYLPLVEAVQQAGGRVCYECIDAWEGSLGAGWYNPAVEDRLATCAQSVTATAPALAERLRARTGRDCRLLPNAVNPRIFRADQAWPRPPDLPSAVRTMVYVGALWGDWFDWGLARRLALELHDHVLALVGDHRGGEVREGRAPLCQRVCPDPPANLRFLGLKPQTELPAYLAHADLAVIPWKVDGTTLATSPLKVYEFLAMGLPVVAPRLPPLEGLPGVVLARDPDHFVEAARHATRPLELPPDFVRRQSWRARVDELEVLWEG